MRVIFLDVDGVLNCMSTRERYKGFVGIESRLVANLAELVECSNRVDDTRIVLSSSWRVGQDRNGADIPDGYGYLLRRLDKYGLSIFDDTPRLKWGVRGRSRRGREIEGWLYLNRELDISGYVVLDDEVFEDFERYGITDHLVLTSMGKNGGFRKEHIREALGVLLKGL